MSDKTYTLTPEQFEEFGVELDAIREKAIADLGERDAEYIRGIIKMQRKLEVGAALCCSCRRLGPSAP